MGNCIISNEGSPPHRLTVDKSEIKDFPKLPSAKAPDIPEPLTVIVGKKK